MKRKAFILTEILTGMMLQTLFALTLCGAFYLILTFSTSTQQILAAHDQGQMVISYIDSRIRNAGIGLHNCESPDGVAKAFNIKADGNMTALVVGGNPLPLPVAITSKTSTQEVISTDGKIYEGNILVLLHAHKDYKYHAQTQEELIVLGTHNESPDLPTTLETGTEQAFKFLPNVLNKDTNSNFDWPYVLGKYKDIKYWAVMEASGVPVRVLRKDSDSDNGTQKFKMIAKYTPATIYPMTELLNLECQRMFVKDDPANNGKSFTFGNINDKGTGWDEYYHTKGILELYMRLDTNANPPIFDLKVLCDEGKSDEDTPKPNNWPAAYWRPEFAQRKVHVSQASWKLYNIAPLYHHD